MCCLDYLQVDLDATFDTTQIDVSLEVSEEFTWTFPNKDSCLHACVVQMKPNAC